MRPISCFLALAAMLLTFVSCAKADTLTITEGVYGTVVERYGNWMPIIGESSKRGGIRHLQREIYVYERTRYQDLDDAIRYHKLTPDNIPTRLVAKTTSSRSGFFQIQLAPGDYSIFILDAGKLYYRISDGEGGLQPLTVEPGETTNIELILDNAVY